jgi:uncharacterized protein YgiB involved in biofilm formation
MLPTHLIGDIQKIGFMTTLTPNTAPTPTLDQQIQDAIKQARQACSTQGDKSVECATAWDIVEEMQANASHSRQKPRKTSLEKYCDDHPDASECRLYDV